MTQKTETKAERKQRLDNNNKNRALMKDLCAELATGLNSQAKKKRQARK